MAATQEALYHGLDLGLSWSESELPERERTKHVHRLHPYLGKFIPQLVEALLDRYVPAGGRVLDPFAGSGTTLVQALESGYDAAGVDIAGFNCLLMRVKTRAHNLAAVRRDLEWAHASSRHSSPPWRTRTRHRSTSATGSRRGPPRSYSTSARSSSRLPRPTSSGSFSRARRDQPGARPTSISSSRAPRRMVPYWCYKHRRECRPVEEARRFLLRYTLDSLERIERLRSIRDVGEPCGGAAW